MPRRQPEQEEVPEAERKTPLPPSRQGKKQVAFFVDRETKLQLDRLALEEDRNLQGLMLEACNLLFQSRGMARIAEQKT
ncbi:ribbon-helix-helix domain-containing protein [Pseudoroseomonas ludipueritiae]